MHDVLLFAVLGLGAGAVYAILGLGLVLVHRGSGVVNFAHAAIALFAAYVFVDLTDRGLDHWTAFAVTLVLAACGGVLIYFLVIRPLREAPALARLVATLGVLLTLQSLMPIVFGLDARTVPSLLPSDPVEVLGVTFGRDRLWLLGITIVLTVVLSAAYRFTRFGRATQAAAENEKGAILLGYSPTMIGAANWAIACSLAAVAGILIAPITSLSATTFTLLILPALAAALVGRFSSFSLTALTGVLIGVTQSEITRYQGELPGWFPQQGLKDALPFLVIIVAMIVTGKLIPRRGTLSEGRPPFATPGLIRPRWVLVGAAAVMLGLIVAEGSTTYESAITYSMIAGIVSLSLVVVTGYVGQISLAQMSFAGVGAFAVSKLAEENGVPFLPALALSALIAVPIGLLIGLPALRVRGVNLAIVTIGAAVAIDSFIFQNTDWSGGFDGLGVPKPTLFGWSIDPAAHPQRFGAFVLVVLIACAVMVCQLRRSDTGRRMLAVRDNERAAAANGVNVAATKLQAFALSAFIAALGGSILAYQSGRISFQRFSPLQSIFLVAIAYTAGIASVSGGILAGVLAGGGLSFVLVGELVLDDWYGVISGVVLIVVVITQPDGMAVSWSRLTRRIGRLRARPHDALTEVDVVQPVERRMTVAQGTR